jgi:hypothetical protein
MGTLPGALSYGQQHDNFRREVIIDVEATDVTTDPEEGARQIEAMKPKPLKVGDKVRLAACGERTMTVVELQDYDNMAVCEWKAEDDIVHDEAFPVRSLVRVEAAEIAG